MSTTYDIVTVGGGVAGASLAKVMAERGYRVLVVEREKQFKDRVRGEWMAPWGVAEATELGVYDALMEAGGHLTPKFTTFAGPMALPPRDLTQDSAQKLASLTMYHPAMQETLLAEAEKAGADVRRGARVRNGKPGHEPEVEIESDAGAETVTARLVVGADGRNSVVRKWGGLEAVEQEPAQMLTGVLLDNVECVEDANVIVFNPYLGQIALMFPQGGKRARAYFGCRTASGTRLQGDKDFQQFVELCVKTGAPTAMYEGAKQAGPVASFPGYDSWVTDRYKNGIALSGDAAATSDQTWGQGLSLAMRDVRELRDALLATDDWEAAGQKYAVAANGCFQQIRRVEDWMTLLLMAQGPEADAVRARVLPRIAMDATILPDTHFAGPDLAPANDEAYARLFGE